MRGSNIVLKRIYVAAAVLFGLSVVAELGLRVVLGLGEPLLYAPSDQYGYLPAPNQRLHRFFVNIDIDANGFRSGSFGKKSDGDRRILFLGDSVTFGTTYVDQSEIFTSLIQKKLNAKGSPKTEILNASAGGWAPENELRFLTTRGSFGAQLVVLVLNTDDLIQPFSTLPASEQYPVHKPLLALSELFSRYILPRIQSRQSSPVLADPGSVAPQNPPVDTETPKILQTLFAMRDVVQRSGGKFEIVFCPAGGPVRREYKADWDRARSMLLKWAGVWSISVIDMTDAFSDHAEGDIYFDGIHLRPLAHRLLAESFAAEIGRN